MTLQQSVTVFLSPTQLFLTLLLTFLLGVLKEKYTLVRDYSGSEELRRGRN